MNEMEEPMAVCVCMHWTNGTWSATGWIALKTMFKQCEHIEPWENTLSSMSRYAFGKLLSSQVSIFFLFPFCDTPKKKLVAVSLSVLQTADVRTFVQLENITDWNAHEKIPLFQEDDDVENDDGYFVFFVFPFALLVRFVPYFFRSHIDIPKTRFDADNHC